MDECVALPSYDPIDLVYIDIKIEKIQNALVYSVSHIDRLHASASATIRYLRALIEQLQVKRDQKHIESCSDR